MVKFIMIHIARRNMMRKIAFFILIFPIFHGSIIYALDISGSYDNADSFLDSLTDPNTGLTAFPSLLIPMGGRYEAMGTAFTAIADDSSFIEANPAGSSSLEHTEFSLFHNNWIADTNIESLIYASRIGYFGFAVAGKFLYVPFTGYDSTGSSVSKGYYSESVVILNASYRFLASYNFYGIAVGANIKAAYRHIPSSIYENQSAFSAMADIGILTRFNMFKPYSSRDKNTSVGITIKNLGIKTLDDPLPMEASVGFSYSPLRPITISGDFTIPFSFNYSEYPAEQWSFAVGTDITITKFFSIQGGFRYRGSNPRVSLGAMIDLGDIAINANYTLDLTTQVGLDRFSIASSINLGDRGRSLTADLVDEYYVKGLEIYAEGDLVGAMENWGKALSLDPGFTPAATNIIMAKQTLELFDDVQSIQIVD